MDFVTYLHPHGHEQKIPWYRGKVNFLSMLHWTAKVLFKFRGDFAIQYKRIRSSLRILFRIWQEWSYLRGGLTTIDRDYGLFNNIHHDTGTHVIHHLFPQIPHYHLVEAVIFLINFIKQIELTKQVINSNGLMLSPCRLKQQNQWSENTIASRRNLGLFQFTWSRIYSQALDKIIM